MMCVRDLRSTDYSMSDGFGRMFRAKKAKVVNRNATTGRIEYVDGMFRCFRFSGLAVETQEFERWLAGRETGLGS